MLSLMQFALLAGLLLALVLSGLLAALERPLRRLLAGKPPAQRARLLWWALATPALTGAVHMALVLLTSLAFEGSSGLAAACASHSNKLMHLCVWHPHDAGQSALLWTALGTLLGTGLWLTWKAVGSLWHARRRLLSLVRLGRRCGHTDQLRILESDQPMALACGIGQRHILLSRALLEQLEPVQLRVVLAHEQAHIAHRDVLKRLFAAALSRLHWPATRRSLLRDLELALEQRSDLAAANAVGTPIAVAETIVAVERMFQHHTRPNSALSMAFVSNFVPERVEALLAPARASSPCLGGILAAAVLALCALSVGWLHHTTEALLHLLAG
jgi:Zn-dependent protease with chaperone function